jgi:hypothetical protein
MAFDVYFRDDIQDRIVGVLVGALAATVAQGSANLEHTRGVIDGQKALAATFCLRWPSIRNATRVYLIENEQDNLLQIAARVL